MNDSDILKHSLAVSNDVDKLVTKCSEIYHAEPIRSKRKRPATAKQNVSKIVKRELANESFRHLKARIVNESSSIYSSVNPNTKNSNFLYRKLSFKPYLPKYSKLGRHRQSLNQTRKISRKQERKRPISHSRSGVKSHEKDIS